MSLVVLPQRPEASVSTPIVRVRGWVSALLERVTDKRADASSEAKVDHALIGSPAGNGEDTYQTVADKEGQTFEQGIVLRLPRTDRVRLVELAEALKQRFAEIAKGECELFLLRLETGRYPRLRIDASAYVEFHGVSVGYRVVLEDTFDACLTLETRDLECATAFIGHYIVARLHPAGQGAA